MRVRIENVCEGTACIEMDVSESEYNFLKCIAEELDKPQNHQNFSPGLYITVVQPKEPSHGS